MNLFISGGCKNGKSSFAQKEAKRQAEEEGRPLYYVATMIPSDGEDRERIRRHIADREGWGFTTLERGWDITGLLTRKGVDRDGVFLVDSVTALLGNEMFFGKGGDKRGGSPKVRRGPGPVRRDDGSQPLCIGFHIRRRPYI